MLRHLKTHDVGPAQGLDLEFGARLNVLTGDNGLGKSFVLDLIWWVLTGSWAGRMALPSGQNPRIEYQAAGGHAKARFDFQDQEWSWWTVHATAPRGSVIYFGADRIACFVKDRNHWRLRMPTDDPYVGDNDAFRFTGRELWEGKRDRAGHQVCNGLIYDLVDWMRRRPVDGFDEQSGRGDVAAHGFDVFESVLAQLSPPGGPPLKLGTPRRVFVEDTREIPTLVTPWESEAVPVPLAAAGIRRILELAYLLVWVWREHVQVTQLKHLTAQRELTLIIDEPELHLHPRWQRAILPALVDVAKRLDPQLQLQLFVTTHSPLVLASGELLVEPNRDRLFHFDTRHDGVRVEELEWVKQGDVIGWLTSEVFGFARGGSLEAERIVKLAEAYMQGRMESIPEALRDKAQLDAELARVLAASDPFWTRWALGGEDVAQ